MKRLLVLSLIAVCSVVVLAQLPVDNFSGETLKYRIKYGALVGGEAKTMAKPSTYAGDKTTKVKIDCYTTGFVNALFHMHDIFESELRNSDGMPLKFVRNVQEGKYVQFEQVNYKDQEIVSTIKGSFPVKERYHDLISAIYYMRRLDFDHLHVGQIVTIPVYYEEQVMMLPIVYQGTDIVTVNKRDYHCYKVEPVMKEVKMFSKKQPLAIWISADNQRKPILIKVNFKVGSFKGEIVEQ